ncbi:hypothetical protein, partial [Lactobacillus crispatus]|uniref:hypothetical protein n=1 Tax=Lactobacillus crispatus TaxID=47770 RepID=UPI003F235B9D
YILSKSPNGLFLIFERSVQFDFTIRLAIYLLEKKFSMCVNWNEFLSCFEYFKTKTEMCTIFAFDTHAPIEARLYVSKMAVDYFRKHDNKN